MIIAILVLGFPHPKRRYFRAPPATNILPFILFHLHRLCKGRAGEVISLGEGPVGCETTKPLDPGYKPSRRGQRRNSIPTRPARPFSPVCYCCLLESGSPIFYCCFTIADNSPLYSSFQGTAIATLPQHPQFSGACTIYRLGLLGLFWPVPCPLVHLHE